MDIISSGIKGNKNVNEVQVLNDLIPLNHRPITILVPNKQTIKTESISSQSQKIPRPANAFMIFANENRKKVAKDFPQESNKEISCRLGVQWKSLSPKEKEKYYSMAKILDADHKRKYPDYVYNPKEARIRKAMRERERSIGAAQIGSARSRRPNWPKTPVQMQGPGPSTHPDHLLGAPSKDLCSALRAEMEHGFLAGNGGYVYPSQQYQFSPQSDYATYIQMAPGLSNWVQNQYNMQQQGNALAQQQIWNQYQSERLRAQQTAGSPYLMNSQGQNPEYHNIEQIHPSSMMQMRSSPSMKPTIHQNLQNATTEVERYMNIPNTITSNPTTSTTEVRTSIPDTLRTPSVTPRNVVSSSPISIAAETVETTNSNGLEVTDAVNSAQENNTPPEMNISNVTAMSEVDAQINSMETTGSSNSDVRFGGTSLFDDGNIPNISSDIKELSARKNVRKTNPEPIPLVHAITRKSEIREPLRPIHAPGRSLLFSQNNYIIDQFVPELSNPYQDQENIILNRTEFPTDFSAQKYYESVANGNFDGPLMTGEPFGGYIYDDGYGFMTYRSSSEISNLCTYPVNQFEMVQYLNDCGGRRSRDTDENFILDLSKMPRNEEVAIDVGVEKTDHKN